MRTKLALGVLLLWIFGVFGGAGKLSAFPAAGRAVRIAGADGVQLLDSAGRPLYFGYVAPGRTLFFVPPGAVAASSGDAAITEIPLDDKIVLPADFWIEVSKAAVTAKNEFTIAKNGYLVSDFIPRDYKLTANVGGRKPEVLWYDSDYNYLGSGPSFLRGKDQDYRKRFSNGAFYRVFLNSRTVPGNFTLQHAPLGEGTSLPAPMVWEGVEIVLKKDADIRERLAATELSAHAKLVSGKAIPILNAPSANRKTVIFIGRGFAEKHYAGVLAALEKTDGYAGKRSGEEIYLFGATPRGTLYSAFHFIESNLKLIWMRPNTEFGTIFTPQQTLSFDHCDYQIIPDFEGRSWSGPGGFDYTATSLWWARNRIKNSAISRYYFSTQAYWDKTLGHQIRIGGSCMDFIRPLKDKYPECMPLVDGTRNPVKRSQICFTNENSPKAFAESVDRMFAECPEETVQDISAVLEDSWACCECPTCIAPIRLADGTTVTPTAGGDSFQNQRFRSIQLFQFLNRALAEVRKKYPEATLTTHAYVFSAAYPTGIKIAPGIYAELCPYPTANVRFPLLKQHNKGPYAPESWAVRYQDWLDGHGKWVELREYYFPSYFAMFAEPAVENLRALWQAGGRRFYSQSQPDSGARKSFEGEGYPENMWDVNAMDQWIISRFLIDTKKTVPELRREFLQRSYPGSWQQLAKFYELFAKRWFDPSCGEQINCHAKWGPVLNTFVVQPKLEKQMRNLLATAIAKETNPNSKTQLQRMLKNFDQHLKNVGRKSILNVPEIADEWRDYNSTHWEKADGLRQFRKLHNAGAAAHKTEVLFAHHNGTFYVRVTSDGKAGPVKQWSAETYSRRDRVELFFHLMLPDKKGRLQRAKKIFVVGADGAQADMLNWDHGYNSGWQVAPHTQKDGTWGATVAIPLSEVLGPEQELRFFVNRVAEDGEESYSADDEKWSSPFPPRELQKSGGNYVLQ